MTVADRPRHRRYLEHLRTCQRAGLGQRCHECRVLCQDADAEDYRRWEKKLGVDGAEAVS